MTVTEDMLFDAVRTTLETLQSDIANGPIVPTVTPEEIRTHLKSRYDFSKPRPGCDRTDVEQMLRSGKCM